MKRTLVTVLVLLTAVVSAAAQKIPAERVKVTDAYGQTQKRIARAPDRWGPLAVGDLLASDSAVRTSDGAAILLQAPDGHAIRVGAASTLELKEVGKQSVFSFQLIAGEIWSFVNKANKPTKFEIDTPTAVLGVRGTVFHVAHDEGENESIVSVNEGIVSLDQEGATVNVEKGSEMRIRPKQLAKVRPEKMAKGTEEMWKLVLKEDWAKASGKPKLNKDSDAELKRLRQKIREEIAKRRREEQEKQEKERAKQAAANAAAAQAARQKEARAAQEAAKAARAAAREEAQRQREQQRQQRPARGGQQGNRG